MPATYAEELADRGYAVLAFDFRNWGESGGNERQLENPTNKTQDIIAAANYLTKRPEVNPNRIAGLGICASAGYMADAAVQSDDIRAIALVAPWLHDRKIVNEVYDGEESVQSLIATSRQAQTKYETTGELSLIPAASDTDPNAVMQQAPYYTDPERGAIPEYINDVTQFDFYDLPEAVTTANVVLYFANITIPLFFKMRLVLMSENLTVLIL